MSVTTRNSSNVWKESWKADDDDDDIESSVPIEEEESESLLTKSKKTTTTKNAQRRRAFFSKQLCLAIVALLFLSSMFLWYKRQSFKNAANVIERPPDAESGADDDDAIHASSSSSSHHEDDLVGVVDSSSEENGLGLTITSSSNNNSTTLDSADDDDNEDELLDDDDDNNSDDGDKQQLSSEPKDGLPLVVDSSSSSSTSSSSSSTATTRFGTLHKTQVENYKMGRALMKLFTFNNDDDDDTTMIETFCSEMRKWGPVPKDISCRLSEMEKNLIPLFNSSIALWNLATTDNTADDAAMIPILREYFHFISASTITTTTTESLMDNDLSSSSSSLSLSSNHPKYYYDYLDYENLLSVYITRNPIHLALDRMKEWTELHYPKPQYRITSDVWWRWANDVKIHKIPTKNDNDASLSKSAKQVDNDDMLDRFTIIIDADCLVSKSIQMLRQVLGVDMNDEDLLDEVEQQKEPSALERIGNNETLYEYLIEKYYQTDMKRHELAKSRSIFKCDEYQNEETEESDFFGIPYINGVNDLDNNDDDDDDDMSDSNNNSDSTTTTPAPDVPINIDEIHQEQIKNYKSGTAIMKLIHITHHAGTFFSGQMKGWGKIPSFNGMFSSVERDTLRPFNESNILFNMISKGPWSYETTSFIPIIREHFHFMSLEYRGKPTMSIKYIINGQLNTGGRNMYDTNWEYKNLVSIYVTRDPLDRALSGDGDMKKKYPPESDRTSQDWWNFANEPMVTNNFALAALSDFDGCCHGADTNPIALENAKKLLRRFTIVLDATCLSESVRELAKLMGKENITVPEARHTHPSARERLANDTLYEYLLERNKLDIEMHKFAQSRSLLKCDELLQPATEKDGSVVVAETNGKDKEATEERDEDPTGGAVEDEDSKEKDLPIVVDKVDGTTTHAQTTATASTPVVDGSSPPIAPFNIRTIHAKQVENYKAGKALMKLVHIVHHAGTFFCGEMSKWGPTPSFACMMGNEEQHNVLPFNTSNALWNLMSEPWTKDATDVIIPIIREKFHYVSSEWRGHPTDKGRHMYDMNYENENLVSVYVTKHPIDRALSGDGWVNKHYPQPENRTSDDWWKWANDPKIANNYALASLSDYSGCCDGANTNPQALENAKKLLTRFTVILDADCLSQSLRELAKWMGKGDDVSIPEPRRTHPPARERIGNDTLYEYLLERNKLDIQMHEFAKSRSLLNCEDLSSSSDDDGDQAPKSIDGLEDLVDEDLVDSKKQVIASSGPPNLPANLDGIHRKQIENYKAGSALMKIVHITHHAGTFFCTEMRKWGPVPSFNCMFGKIERDDLPPFNESQALWNMIANNVWTQKDSALVPIIREYFHFMGTEYRGSPAKGNHMYDTNWEYEDLVSIYVTRDPLDRALAGDGDMKKKYPPEADRTAEDWWNFANEPKMTNNFALAVLSDHPSCCHGADTNPIALENAKKLLRRFTIVLDATCLSESVRELAKLMGKNVTVADPRHTHPSARERLGNDTLYEYLLERNKLDVAMHKYAQSRSLLDCSKL